MATVIKNVNEMFNNGENLTTAINYLYTCDFEDNEIVKFFTENFNCSEEGIRFELRTQFGVEF